MLNIIKEQYLFGFLDLKLLLGLYIKVEFFRCVTRIDELSHFVENFLQENVTIIHHTDLEVIAEWPKHSVEVLESMRY